MEEKIEKVLKHLKEKWDMPDRWELSQDYIPKQHKIKYSDFERDLSDELKKIFDSN